MSDALTLCSPDTAMPSLPARRTAPFRFSVITATGFIVLLAVLLAGYALIRQRAYQEKLERTERAAAATLERYEARLADVPRLTGSEKGAMRRFLNPVHLDYAQSLGVDRPESRAEAERLIGDEALREIGDNPLYDVAPMDYSVPAVTPATRDLLTLIGRRFHERLDEASLPPYRFQITSATRTTEDQDRLRRINVNAAQNSAHMFGTTVDIHYARFFPPAAVPPPADSLDVLDEPFREIVEAGLAELGQAHHEALKGVLGRVMLELQREGHLVVVYERRQPVYHLTVARQRITPDPGTPGDLAHHAGP